MRWMIQGKLTPAVIEALKRHEEQVSSVITASDPMTHTELLAQAAKQQLDLLTGDAEMIDALYASDAPRFVRSVVYLQLAGGDVEQDDAIDRLFTRYKRLTPGRMYTVTENRVKIRQLPGANRA